ncbi:MAG: NUDIX domain-containing protein [Chitinispirillaceae bacterium]|nr:NUDIX domain-containing protein [Chitinispirillaceae bacterium]
MAENGACIKQAGSIVVKPGAPPQVLLVKARNNPAHWIFPKGHIEAGETAGQAAARELLEEAGVAGKPVRMAGESTYWFQGKCFHVDYFLLRYASTDSDGEPGRSPSWHTIEEALSLLSFTDARKVLGGILPLIRSIM